ncbi:MAG: NapH/MauN family ferredoxin-type protein [Magnetococcus sp. WYHC-3]
MGWGKTRFSDAAQAIHEQRRQEARSGQRKLEGGRRHLDLARENARTTWKRRRWATLIFINALFMLSYWLDIQLLEGSLTASRFLGFHLADPFSALQIWLAFGHMILNLVIGTTTLVALYLIVGGRSFCSWVCPYHLLSEWGEMLHLRLAQRGWVRDHSFRPGMRYAFMAVFLLGALLTGYTLFETISPVGLLSRALIYGPGLGLLWIALLLFVEVFYSRRAWCRYICPVGLTYRLVGAASLFKVKYNLTHCAHDGACRQVCLVPHVLDVTRMGHAPDVDNYLSGDCTNCGMCVDLCPTGSLTFEFRWLSKLT